MGESPDQNASVKLKYTEGKNLLPDSRKFPPEADVYPDVHPGLNLESVADPPIGEDLEAGELRSTIRDRAGAHPGDKARDGSARIPCFRW